MTKKLLVFLLAVVLIFDHFGIGHSMYFAVPRKLSAAEKEKARSDEVDLALARKTLPEIVKARSNLAYAKQNLLKYFPVNLRMNGTNYGFEFPKWNVDNVFEKATDVFEDYVYALCSKDGAKLETKYKQKDLDITRLMVVANKTNKHIEVYSC